MKKILRPVLMLTVVATLAFMANAFADNMPPEPNLDADAKLNLSLPPPTVTHEVTPDMEADTSKCVACHANAVNNATKPTHLERQNCTQCHVQGDPRPVAKPAPKKKAAPKK